MSTAPYYLRKARFGYNAGNALLLDLNTESQPRSQPEKIYGRFDMRTTAEDLQRMYKISREAQDEFAYKSHVKVLSAIEADRFKNEIIPIRVREK